ncbi:helical backbone metal receptor [soil metagenome]
MRGADRIVSLVPSVTHALAALGAGDRVVGVTDWCTRGVPAGAARVGGTKNPSLDRVAALAPDAVVVNLEENRADDVDALAAAGLDLVVTHPRRVEDVAVLIRRLAGLVGRPDRAEPLLADLDAARQQARWRRPDRPLAALTLVWRRPWRGVGPGTYVDDLLACCGFANVLAGFRDPWPGLDPALVLGPEVVLLPSEPYAFGEDDVPAVHELLGAAVPRRFVDGELLTWHGPLTAAALRELSALAADVAAA